MTMTSIMYGIYFCQVLNLRKFMTNVTSNMIELYKIFYTTYKTREGCNGMANIYGRKFSKRELLKRVGDMSQLAGAKKCTLDYGKAKGVAAVDVKTGSGLNFTILPDRGLDLAWAEYKGISFGYLSKTGIVSPYLHDFGGNEFARGFYGGLMTTCGMTNIGTPCIDEGTKLETHGRASYLPADDLCVTNDWVGDDYIMKVSGKTRESALFGENIVLFREITAKLGENKIKIKDTIENCGFTKQPLMMLYHCNFGFPLIDATTEFSVPGKNVRARDDEAKKGIDECKVFSDPIPGYSEQVFYHDPDSSADGKVTVSLINKTLNGTGITMNLSYNKKQLPHLMEWKMMGEGDYVVGVEPGTWYPEGRCEARKRGELLFMEPGEIKNFEIEIEIKEGY